METQQKSNMAFHTQVLTLCMFCLSCVLAAYDPYSYDTPKYHQRTYQTYDKRALKDYGNAYSPSRYNYNSYSSSIKSNSDYGKSYKNNDDYGYQTRTTYIEGNKYYLPQPYKGDGTYNILRGSYYKQAAPSTSYYEAPYSTGTSPKRPFGQTSYGYEPYSSTKGNDYGYGVSAIHGDSYGANVYDPCTQLPEGDYALQAEFTSLYPGIDAQCNFVKCANYKSYVNPCSIGTKNDEYGGPHEKYGFCAETDYKHYCGVIPPAPRENYYEN